MTTNPTPAPASTEEKLREALRLSFNKVVDAETACQILNCTMPVIKIFLALPPPPPTERKNPSCGHDRDVPCTVCDSPGPEPADTEREKETSVTPVNVDIALAHSAFKDNPLSPASVSTPDAQERARHWFKTPISEQAWDGKADSILQRHIDSLAALLTAHANEAIALALEAAAQHFRCMKCGQCTCQHSETARSKSNESIEDFQEHVRSLLPDLAAVRAGIEAQVMDDLFDSPDWLERPIVKAFLEERDHRIERRARLEEIGEWHKHFDEMHDTQGPWWSMRQWMWNRLAELRAGEGK